MFFPPEVLGHLILGEFKEQLCCIFANWQFAKNSVCNDIGVNQQENER